MLASGEPCLRLVAPPDHISASQSYSAQLIIPSLSGDDATFVPLYIPVTVEPIIFLKNEKINDMCDVLIGLNILSKKQDYISSGVGTRAFQNIFRKISII